MVSQNRDIMGAKTVSLASWEMFGLSLAKHVPDLWVYGWSELGPHRSDSGMGGWGLPTLGVTPNG